MSIRMPRLLDAQQQERARLHPAQLKLQLRLAPLSTAEMLLPAGSVIPLVRDLVELYDENGSLGVFRVSGTEQLPGLSTRVFLEHGLASLGDHVTRPMSLTGTVREVFDALLACQQTPLWTLGDAELPQEMTMIFTCGCESLLSALLRAMELLPEGYGLFFDQTAAPWQLHIRALPVHPACEGRLSRNLTGIAITMDGSDICTCVYPYGAGQGVDRVSLLPLTGSECLTSAAADRWGVISRTFTVSGVFDAETLRVVAEKYLARHGEPTVSIVADALDLSAATGESADRFSLGSICRLALPEEGLILSERIIAIDHPDVISQPGKTRITLCSRIGNASDELADMLRQVQAEQVLGGRVADVTTTSRAGGTPTSPIVHYFQVEGAAAVLGCTVTLDPDDGVQISSCAVDGAAVPQSVFVSGTFSALPYLRRTETGVVASGRHTLTIYPSTGAVNSTVSLKIIQRI